ADHPPTVLGTSFDCANAASIACASVAADAGCTPSLRGANHTTASPCLAATSRTAARALAIAGRIQIVRLARARMRSRLARRSGSSGSLLPADTTLISAAGSTRATTAPDGMPILALSLQPRRYCAASTAMLSPTRAQLGALSRAAPLVAVAASNNANVRIGRGIILPKSLFQGVNRQATTPCGAIGCTAQSGGGRRLSHGWRHRASPRHGLAVAC